MKKFQKIIVALVVVVSFAYAGSSMNNEEAVYIYETSPKLETAGFITEVPEFLTDEEAVRCVVTKGDVTVKCWFCNCAKIAAAM